MDRMDLGSLQTGATVSFVYSDKFTIAPYEPEFIEVK